VCVCVCLCVCGGEGGAADVFCSLLQSTNIFVLKFCSVIIADFFLTLAQIFSLSNFVL
jgi:hypothetical protein